MEAARPATPADLPAVAALAAAAIAELTPQRGGGVWHLHTARRGDLGPGLRDDLARSDRDGAFVVGTVEGTVVGYGVSRIEELADASLLAVVTDLYVDPGARAVGVGEAMMDLLVEHAQSVGARGIDALALPGDRETKNFFETFGLKARAIVVHRDLRPHQDGGGAA